MEAKTMSNPYEDALKGIPSVDVKCDYSDGIYCVGVTWYGDSNKKHLTPLQARMLALRLQWIANEIEKAILDTEENFT